MKKIPRVRYTLEFKLEALRRVRGGEAVLGVARELGVPEQTIRNWIKAKDRGEAGYGGQRQADYAGADGDFTAACGERAAEDGNGDHKKSRRVICEGVAVRYAFIDQNRGSYPLQALCVALQVSDSGFAAWQCAEGPKKWLSDRQLLARIREIHEETKAAYGSPRIY